ncbi:hypothetical protein [Streptomyces silvisoli]|uniref:Uncharacterized protein n=1 Tax=Streptomyces silvisoli TaxID=3034235 RepID=A0ABT5ZP12_9ACTN|nr:hypothetical protein [Streptomyces silvisoli]MDF3291553.1 hypothetical protein [Streptomyces silvisoli]
MNNEDPRSARQQPEVCRLPKRGRALRICFKNKLGYLLTFFDWHNDGPMQSVPELPSETAEFIGMDESDLGLAPGQPLLREDDIPLSYETCGFGPPIQVLGCIHGRRGCDHV